MFDELNAKCSELVQQFGDIDEKRKGLLQQIAAYIQKKINEGEEIRLMYVCTHNSRRSHFGQVWAAVAAAYYELGNVYTFSGGTQATAFHPNAIKALVTDGFKIQQLDQTSNPRFKVAFGQNHHYTICFSKRYDDAENPQNNFAAIMTCSDADENCPYISGVDLRVGTTYEDPKAFDGKPLQEQMYLERSHQIAIESLYVFSMVKNKS